MVDVRTNLLKNRPTLSEKEYEQERRYLRSAVVSLVVVVVVVIALSVWNLVLTKRLATTEKSLANASKEMQGLSLASAQQIYLKSRLNLVTEFLKDRSIARESLQKIFSMNFDGVHVSGMAFESETVLSITYTANSTKSLDDLIRYYEADNGYFTQAVSQGISRSKDGNYQLIVALTLPIGDK
ncbi:hypothetical protein KBD75_01215 [Candidatus Woesebacteria bacterium]|nr:hypothetical protein [Candidatus Woesebacteria bacterium]